MSKALLIESRDMLQYLVKEGGACDHEAGICVRKENALISKLNEAINAPEPKPVAWLDPWTQKRCVTDYDAYGERGIPLVIKSDHGITE